MGQWWRIVNLTKKEYIDVRSFGDKSLQSVVAPDSPVSSAGVLAYLLRQSDKLGAGDLGYLTPAINLSEAGIDDKDEKAVSDFMAAEGQKFENIDIPEELKSLEYAGRWSGDAITMIGDYDTSNLYFTIADDDSGFTDIGKQEFADELQRTIYTPVTENSISHEAMLRKAMASAAAAGVDLSPPEYKTVILGEDGDYSIHEGDPYEASGTPVYVTEDGVLTTEKPNG